MAEFDPSVTNPSAAVSWQESRSLLDPPDRQGSAFLACIVDTVRESMLVLDGDLRVILANKSFLDVFHLSEGDTLGKFVYQIGGGELDIPELRAQLTKVLPQRSAIEDFAIDRHFARIGPCHLLVNARALRQDPDSQEFILLAIEDVSARHSAQREIALSRQLLQATLSSIGDGVITTDRDGAVLTMNPVAENLTGWLQDEAKNRPLPEVFKIVNESTGLAVPNPALRALAEGRIVGLANHTFLIGRDGRVRAIDDSAAPIRDLDGDVIGSVLIFRDITTQRALERERERLQKSQTALLASTAEGIYTIDQQGNCTLINRAALQLLGFDEKECLGRGMHELIHHHRSDGAPFHVQDCPLVHVLTEGQTLRDLEDVFWRKDGRPLPVSVSVAPIEIAGKREGAVIAFSDRSERQRIDREREDATDRLRLAMEAARIVSWTWFPERQQLFTSENLAAIYGIASIDSMQQGLDLLVPEDRDRHLRIVRQAIAERSGYHSEFRIVRPDNGELVWLDERAICTSEEGSQSIAFSGITVDVTERRRTQRLLEEANTKLEETAVELRRSNEDLGQFAAVAGHDLQSPLRTIVSYAQLLQLRLGNNLDAELNSCLAFIAAATRDMHALIASLLEYATVGGSVPAENIVDLDREIAGMLSAIQEAVHDSQATVLCEKLPTVRGHAVQLRQLFQNLVMNALTYGDSSRKPVIRIKATGDDAFWTIAVEDNGLGIDEQYLKLIFNPFKRLHGPERPGTGLGLAVCKRIVANHNGDLLVESTPGVGSTFFVRLPKY